MRRGSRPWVVTGALAATVAVVVWTGARAARDAALAARLPTVPAPARQPAAVRDHLAAADRAARGAPRSAETIGALGIAYHADMLYLEAERAYTLADAIDPADWRWTYYRALTRGMRGDAAGLVADLRRVVDVAPAFAPAWWRLGEAEFKAGRHAEAAAAWQRAHALPEPARPTPPAGVPPRVGPPVAAYAALGLARLALLERDADRAHVLLEDATAVTPDFGPAVRLLGDVYLALDRPDASAEALRRADRLPRFSPYLDPLTETLVHESRSSTFLLQHAATADLTTNAAWREYLVRRALEVDPGNPDALFDLGTMLRVLERYDEALAVLERHRRLIPDDLQVVADIGRCLSGLRRYPEAEPVLRAALEGLDNADTRYDLGLVLDRLGRQAEAVAEYRRALDHDPHHPDALNNLGVALASQGQLDAAARLFERLVTVDPDNADAYANLGVVRLAGGARDTAAQAFETALALDPGHTRARAGMRELAP